MHGKITGLLRFGISLNKLFDYLAAGRPIFSDLYTEYDLVAPNGCGITAKKDTAKEIADGLFSMEKLPGDVLRQYGENAKELAKEFDYKKLADKMEQLRSDAQSRVDDYQQKYMELLERIGNENLES